MSEVYEEKDRPEITGDMPENFQRLFDYGPGSITKDHKDVARELANFIEDNPNIPVTMYPALLREKFELVEKPTLKVEDSKWYKYTKDGPDLGPSIQGFDLVNGGKLKIPYIGLGANVNTLDQFIDHVIEKHKQFESETEEK